MPAQAAEPAVELPAQLEHLAGVRGQRLLLPGVGDRAQHRHQRRRRGDQDALAHRVLEQRRVVLQRRPEEHVAGHEQHDELRRRLERAPVVLGGQPVDVGAQVPRMRLHPLGRDVVVLALDGLQVGGERDLGVDDDLLAAGEAHDQVGAEHAVAVVTRRLLGEVAVLDHAGHLDHPAQLHLAPPAAGLRRPQRRDERRGLLAQLLGGLPGEADLLGQRGVGRDAGPAPARAAGPRPGRGCRAAGRPAPRPRCWRAVEVAGRLACCASRQPAVGQLRAAWRSRACRSLAVRPTALGRRAARPRTRGPDHSSSRRMLHGPRRAARGLTHSGAAHRRTLEPRDSHHRHRRPAQRRQVAPCSTR